MEITTSAQTKSSLASFTGQTESEEPSNTLTASNRAASLNLDTNLLTIANQNDFTYILKEIDNRLLVVEFFARWCGPCKLLSGKLEEVTNAYNGKILIIKIDVDEFEELTVKYNISAIPTFVLMKNQKKLEQFSSSDVKTLVKNLEKYAGKPGLNDSTQNEKKLPKVKVKENPSENKK